MGEQFKAFISFFRKHSILAIVLAVVFAFATIQTARAAFNGNAQVALDSTPVPTVTPTPTPIDTPTPTPTTTPTPTATPTSSPTTSPTSSPCPNTSISISDNGPGSTHQVEVHCTSSTTINGGTSTSDIQTNINASANTGGNIIDGSSTDRNITTGSTSVSVNVQNGH